ncbi:rho guanine nucleotide exchange factor 15 [Osmerus eperlanus]|uniref:rho guanine nucleotide exchange factor 15 n=1 Tax=Osmerus eperlanus TaxID=29151 RepID=UPI002E0EE31A
MKLVWVPIWDLDEYVDEYVVAGSGKGRGEQAEEGEEDSKQKPNVASPPVEILRPQHNISPVKNESLYDFLTDAPNYLTLLDTPPSSSSENAGPRGSPYKRTPTASSAAQTCSSEQTPTPLHPRPFPPAPVPSLRPLPPLPSASSPAPTYPQPLNPPTSFYDDLDGEDRPDTEEGEEATVLSGGPRRISSDWESQRENVPLYQDYQAEAIKEALRVQKVCEGGGVKAGLRGDVRKSWALGSDGLAEPRKGPGDVTLWRDLPVVRHSGLLESLPYQELQRQESMFEVLTSEASYLRSLRVLMDHFLMSRDLEETLVVHDKRILFSNVLDVCEVSERFLNDLLERVDEGIRISDVCDIIYKHAEHNFNVYIDYIRDQDYQEKAYSSLIESNKAFAVVMARLEASPLCRRLPFPSFLLLPLQRITRIKILVQNILKRTQEGSREEHSATLALTTVSELIKKSNKLVGQMKQMEELIQITNQLEFHGLKALPLISTTRWLEKRGELQELTKSASLFSFGLKLTPLYLFLFNDLLLVTQKKSPERYVVIDHAHRALVQVKAVDTGDLGSRYEHSFSLLLLENHRGQASERLLKAPSGSDLHRWIGAFPSMSEPSREEVVYEDWDCPQVQCVEVYRAQQRDELSLEPTDIINVLRKTHEGWYEGLRLLDNEKGWFPSSVVVEITNEHVRRRNLREQFRITQATAAIGTES